MKAVASQTRELSPAKALAKLFEDERAFLWREDPLSASVDGVHEFDARLPSVTPAAQERRLRANRRFLRRLREIERGRLNARAQVSYDLFEFMVSQRVTLERYKEWRMPMNSDSGFHSEMLFLDELANPQSFADYENFIARLADVPRYSTRISPICGMACATASRCRRPFSKGWRRASPASNTMTLGQCRYGGRLRSFRKRCRNRNTRAWRPPAKLH